MSCSYSFNPEIKTECIISLVSDIRQGNWKTAPGVTLQKVATILGSAAALLPGKDENSPIIHLAGAGVDEFSYSEASVEDMADELEALMPQEAPEGTSGDYVAPPNQKLNPFVAGLLVTLLQNLLQKLLVAR